MEQKQRLEPTNKAKPTEYIHENGVKEYELTYNMGGIEGDFLEWYPSGKLKGLA